MSGSDLSQPLFPPSEGAHDRQPEEGFEPGTDVVDLAARFTAPNGGGLSPELSVELALEIVLNQIVEQACLATGANGAAIVLKREEEMVCRASNGSTAPALGSRLDTSSGLSGECARTLCTQRCGDVLTDTRADVEASQRLGVRSVMVMPLLLQEELVGFFELFSSQPFAFGDRDERTLEALASRALANLNRTSQPVPPAEISSTSGDEGISAGGMANVAASPAHSVTLVLAAAVVFCAVLLGLLVGRHLRLQKSAVWTHAGAPPSTVVRTTGAESARGNANPPNEVKGGGESARPWISAKPSGNASVPPGSLLVFENGKEIFRLPPAPGESTGAPAEHETGVQHASSLEPEKTDQHDVAKPAPSVAEGSLLYRVDPEYPEEARQSRIQGPVELKVHIRQDGTVADVEVVSGPPVLAKAASDAVKQWRFKPFRDHERTVEMQTRITLNFRLPQ